MEFVNSAEVIDYHVQFVITSLYIAEIITNKNGNAMKDSRKRFYKRDY